MQRISVIVYPFLGSPVASYMCHIYLVEYTNTLYCMRHFLIDFFSQSSPLALVIYYIVHIEFLMVVIEINK